MYLLLWNMLEQTWACTYHYSMLSLILPEIFWVVVELNEMGSVVFKQAPSFKLFLFFQTGSCCVALAGLELMVILLSPPLECWNHRHVTPCPAWGFTLISIVASLYSHQQYRRVPVFPHLHLHLLFVVVFIIATDCAKMESRYSFNFHFPNGHRYWIFSHILIDLCYLFISFLRTVCSSFYFPIY